MNRILIFTGLIVVVLSGCTQRTICPAYQSAFIHDKEALLAHFSYFQPDSTPKLRDVNKSRYLLIEPVAYQKRVRELNNIVMTDIYPVPVDSVDLDDDLMYAERDIVDSAAVGNEKIHPGLIGPFNTDQELYMYYLRDILLLPDARADMSTEASDQGQKKKNRRKDRKNDDTAVEEEKEKKGPFSIFGKKKDKEEEATEEETPQVDPEPTEEQNDEF